MRRASDQTQPLRRRLVTLKEFLVKRSEGVTLSAEMRQKLTDIDAVLVAH